MSFPSEFHETKLYDNGVLHVQLNRPKIFNAMHKPAYLEYGAIFEQASIDPNVRAIVLSGAGRALCAGIDVAGMAGEFDNSGSDISRVGIHMNLSIKTFQKSIAAPYFVNKPVIGVAHGPVIGLGMDILTAVDLRFASNDAKFSIREIELGMAADIGTLQRLPKLVNNLGWAKDVCYSGRDFGVDEAVQQGLVQRTYATKDEAVTAALEFAGELAAKSPVALYGTKKALQFSIDHSHSESLDQIAEFNAYGLGDDFSEGCMAMLQFIQTKKKVTPSFGNL